MKLTLSKQRFVLIVILFFILLFGGVYLLLKEGNMGLLESSRVGNSYEDFARLCSEEKNPSKIVCKAFIIDETEVDDTLCFDLLAYDGVGAVESMMLCDNPSSLNWDNPYGNYEKRVPVVIEISGRKSFLGSSKLENAKLTLMEDQEIYDILNTLPEELGRNSYFQSLIYIKEHQEIFDKGYYITSPVGSDTRNILVLYDAEVKEISSRGGEVDLLLNTKIYEEELSLLVSTEELWFSRIDEMEEGILINAEKVDFFEKDGNFFVSFKFTMEEAEVEEYLKSFLEEEGGEIVLKKEFNLVQIVAKEI